MCKTLKEGEKYNPRQLEAAARQYWQENGSFRVVERPDKEKFYCLSMFPYPSGRLHMGHVRNYTIGDVIARYQRMLGKNVLQPMGWDAFGLPAENAAIKNSRPPVEWTYDNIEYMKGQLKSLGFGYDWDRELATCDADYYRWEQWLFTRLVEKGLAYRKKAAVNWDPVDRTVLANEQVIDGRGWRSGARVERREIEQWFLKITDYAQELLDGLDKLSGWPEQVVAMQRNWIGRSQGVVVDFDIEGADEKLSVFTTRPDTLMGVTCMAVAAQHPLALRAGENNADIAAFIEKCRHGGVSEVEIETMEKEGIALGIHAVHPITGDTLPVYAANFVLMGYGAGAVMVVPAHDERDFHFAKKYGLAIKPVIVPAHWKDKEMNESKMNAAVESEPFHEDRRAPALSVQDEPPLIWLEWDAGFSEKGILIHSGRFSGMTSEEAFDAIAEHLSNADRGGRQVNYRLRDWSVSRQRYWGCPIPMIKTPQGTEPATELPVKLPQDIIVDGSGSPLKHMPEFYDLGDGRQRETDTFDTFFESSWYYARYCCPDADKAMLDERARYWLPVDQYVGGIEHAILHLLYARFFNRLMRDEGLLDNDEPFTCLLTQGMVVAETWYRQNEDGSREWFNPADVETEKDNKGKTISARLRSDRQPVSPGGIEKMSKSKNNGADPQTLIDRYGADTVRLYTMFTAPPEQSLEWSDEGVEGASRFMKRLWNLAGANPGIGERVTGNPVADNQRDARREVHGHLKKALFDYQRQQFNTVVSACMSIVNILYRLADSDDEKRLLAEGLGIVLRLLGPIAPHITHTLWRDLGYGDDILNAPWPEVDESALVRDSIEMVVQVKGRVRGRIKVSADADDAAIREAALANKNIHRFIDGAHVKKIIIVPGKLVNVVVQQ